MTPPGPVGAEARRILGRYLRALRNRAGLTGREAEAAATLDQGHISRVENGLARLGPKPLARLLTLYRADSRARYLAHLLWSRTHLPEEARGIWLDLGPDGRPLGPR